MTDSIFVENYRYGDVQDVIQTRLVGTNGQPDPVYCLQMNLKTRGATVFDVKTRAVRAHLLMQGTGEQHVRDNVFGENTGLDPYGWMWSLRVVKDIHLGSTSYITMGHPGSTTDYHTIICQHLDLNPEAARRRNAQTRWKRLHP